MLFENLNETKLTKDQFKETLKPLGIPLCYFILFVKYFLDNYELNKQQNIWSFVFRANLGGKYKKEFFWSCNFTPPLNFIDFKLKLIQLFVKSIFDISKRI